MPRLWKKALYQSPIDLSVCNWHTRLGLCLSWVQQILPITNVAEEAVASFPNSHITISTLLPRRDFYPGTIHRVNRDITRGCASLANVHVAHHPAITPEHLFDHFHLKKKAVGIFTKSLKDVALGCQSLHLTSTRGAARGPSREPHYAPDPLWSQRPPRHPPRPGARYRPPPPPLYHTSSSKG